MQWSHSFEKLLDARGCWITSSFCGVLNRVLLKGPELSETLSAPHALKLGFTRVNDAMFSQVLALLESFVAGGTLEGFLAGVHSAMPLQLRRIFKAPLAVSTFHRFLSGGVAAVLHEI